MHLRTECGASKRLVIPTKHFISKQQSHTQEGQGAINLKVLSKTTQPTGKNGNKGKKQSTLEGRNKIPKIRNRLK